VSNGTKVFLPGVDGRSALARRARDVMAAIVSDLGGVDQLSEAELQLVRRATLISVQCEKWEADAVAGQDIPIETYGAMTDRLGRAFQRLGLKRRARDVTPPLRDYLSEVEA
jgi:hypothetical protein